MRSTSLIHIYLWSGWLTRQIKYLITRALGVIPHPIPEVNFLMVEIPTPKPYIFMITVNRQIKCPKSWNPGPSPSPTRIFFKNYTYLGNHFVNFNQTLPKCSLGDPLPKLCSVCLGSKEGGLKSLIIYKNLLLVNQQCQKIDTWHITLINLENRNPVWLNDFDLQLGCCISDAFSIFVFCFRFSVCCFSSFIRNQVC